MPQGNPILRDTTLREGAQIPGARAALTDQQRFVELLDGMGVQEIESGLPSGVDPAALLARLCEQPDWSEEAILACIHDLRHGKQPT